jgi:hypothetical protein
MSESSTPTGFPHPSWSGLARLLSLVGRSECPPRPADGLLFSWHQASGTSLTFAEWCDPAARDLAAALSYRTHTCLADSRHVDAAIVAFAQARAGADHSASALADDLMALLQLLEPDDDDPFDPVDLVARALAAWASEQVAVVSTASCIDPVTGLVNGGFLQARLRELHAQCESLAIAPSITFGSLVIRLDLGTVPAAERMPARVAVGRALGLVFRAGETVAALDVSRLVAVMPAYALGRAEGDVQIALAQRPELIDVPVHIDRVAFEDDVEETWRSLAGTRVRA